MADDAGQPADHLTLPAPAEAMDFFELLARLEDGGGRFGHAGRPADEPARLNQSPRLAFATRDVAALAAPAPDAAPRVEVALIGLLGPEGPMPLHLTRWVLGRLSQRWFDAGGDGATADTAFLDFCTVLQHRMIALFFRAWADARPGGRPAARGGDRTGAMLAALAGIGLDGGRQGAEGAATAPLKLMQATSLGHEVNAPERLARLVGALVGAPVRVVEFVGDWVDQPRHLQTRLGCAYARLGRDAVLGPRSFHRQFRAELRVGPLPLSGFLDLAGSAAARARLVHAVRFVAGREIDFDLRLVLAGSEVPAPRLGDCRLGRTAWLSRGAGRDRDDLRLPRITAAAGREERAA